MVHESDIQTVHLALPPDPNITEEQLEAVSAGFAAAGRPHRPAGGDEADIAVFNATMIRPVILAHTPAGRTLPADHCGLRSEQVGWACVERASSTGNRKFRELHGKFIAAHIVLRNDQASLARPDELTAGEYPHRRRTRGSPEARRPGRTERSCRCWPFSSLPGSWRGFLEGRTRHADDAGKE